MKNNDILFAILAASGCHVELPVWFSLEKAINDPKTAWLTDQIARELLPAYISIQILANTERIIKLLERKDDPQHE